MPSMNQHSSPRYYSQDSGRGSNRASRSLDDFYVTQDQIVGNAALKPEIPVEEPVYDPREGTDRNRSEETVQHRKDSAGKPRRQDKGTAAKVLIVAFVIVIAAFMVGQAVNSNRIFTANQELRELQEKLKDAQEETASVSNGVDAEISLNDLYGYATGYLGMREVTKEDITVLPPLDKNPEDPVASESTHEPTKVRIHLFGN